MTKVLVSLLSVFRESVTRLIASYMSGIELHALSAAPYFSVSILLLTATFIKPSKEGIWVYADL